MVKWRIQIYKEIRFFKWAKREENYLKNFSLMFLTIINIGSRKIWCIGKRFAALKVKPKFCIIEWYIKFQFFFSFWVFLPFLGLLRPHMEVPRSNRSHSHWPTPEPQQWPTPQLMATLDPWPTEQGQGSNPQPHGSQSDSLTTVPQWELPIQNIL